MATFWATFSKRLATFLSNFSGSTAYFEVWVRSGLFCSICIYLLFTYLILIIVRTRVWPWRTFICAASLPSTIRPLSTPTSNSKSPSNAIKPCQKISNGNWSTWDQQNRPSSTRFSIPSTLDRCLKAVTSLCSQPILQIRPKFLRRKSWELPSFF